MEKLQVITKVDTTTYWVNSMVVVEKPSGALRICLDPRDLNKVIHRPHYPLKTPSDILPELSGARYFTKLDARSGYWTIKLDNDSSYLTTFNTPYGRYRFLRLPSGLKSAQDEFQRKIDYYYAGLRGVVAIVDDVLGMVNHLSKFAPTLVEVTSPMRQLLFKKSEFVWDFAQKESFARSRT